PHSGELARAPVWPSPNRPQKERAMPPDHAPPEVPILLVLALLAAFFSDPSVRSALAAVSHAALGAP
ncbi:MAG: hypothetical protein ACREF1_04420, partial [Acetobacteraceae bacterium]